MGFWIVLGLLSLSLAMSIASKNYLAALGWLCAVAGYVRAQALELEVTRLILKESDGKK